MNRRQVEEQEAREHRNAVYDIKVNKATLDQVEAKAKANERQWQHDRRMELSDKASAQFHQETKDDYEKRKTVVEAGRETARINAEDQQVWENDKMAKKRAQESLESQINLSHNEAKKKLEHEHNMETFKNQVTKD